MRDLSDRNEIKMGGEYMGGVYHIANPCKI